jgi:inosine-uridine nucleoside N-ribohydrolase
MHLLQSGPDRHSDLPGEELVARKVRHFVVMGGLFPDGKEWNFEMHPEAAAYVTENWPTGITFTGYEIGAEIRTGRRLHTDTPADHPVRRSYAWYGGEGGIRESWDLTAVLYAAEGPADYWDVVRGRIEVDPASGANRWEPHPSGQHGYLARKMEPEKIVDLLDELLVRLP